MRRLFTNPHISLSLSNHHYQLRSHSYFKFHTPKESSRNILVTAALPYVNNTPHLGNIIGGVLSADVYARYCKIMNYNTFFVCGTDEYGTTTEVKAMQEKVSEKQICDKYHQLHKNIYQWFMIDFDYFGRTTHQIHTQISQQILAQIYQNKAIIKKKCQQFYCPSCQMNLADRYVKGKCSCCGAKAKGDQCDSCSKVFKQPTIQLLEPSCSICSTAPQIRESEHLYLQLSAMNEKISNWVRNASNQPNKGIKLWSNNAQGVTKGWINNKLEDRCITRDLKWGVTVPDSFISGKVMYVWFEAPLGYISMTAKAMNNIDENQWRRWWTPSSQIQVELNQFMGKDNIMFHSIMAPATLMATNKNYIKPHRIAASQYLMFEGGKFSKSNNFGVFGNDCIEIGIPADVWRYCLISNRPQTFDTQFTWQYLATRNNVDLVNTVGNMCQRILKYVYNKLNKKCPLLIVDSINDEKLTQIQRTLLKQFSKKVEEYFVHLQKVELKASSQNIIEMAAIMNKYLQDSQFWTKQNVNNKRNQVVMGLSLNILCFYGIMIQPILPRTSQNLLSILNKNNLNRTFTKHPLNQFWDYAFNKIPNQYASQDQKSQFTINEPFILFNPSTYTQAIVLLSFKRNGYKIIR